MSSLKIVKKLQTLINESKYKEAISILNAPGLDLRPAQVDTFRGFIELRLNNFPLAEKFLKKAVSLEPKLPLANGFLATTLIRLGKKNEAREYAEIAYKLAPGMTQHLVNIVSYKLDDQKFDDVIEMVLPHIGKGGCSANLYAALITAYRSTFQNKLAEKYLADALILYPDYPDFKRLKADIFAEFDVLKAKSAFEVALKHDPDDQATRWNKSFVDLRMGNFAEGWKNYEYGLSDKIGKIGRPIPKLFSKFKQLHSIQEIVSDSVVVVAEQGIGDQVIFLSAISELTQKKKVIYVCERRFVKTIRRSFPEITVVEYGAPNLFYEKIRDEGYLPLGSIMKDFRGSLKSFEDNKKQYLYPNESKVTEYRNSLMRFSEGKKIIGISWKGGFWERAQKSKTIELEHWLPILKRQDFCFVNLQYGDCSEERKFAKEQGINLKFIQGIDFKKDLDAWFSLACACDSILSVSTAIVHFAGAAGKKVNLLLSGYMGPFIWGLDEGPSYLYSHVYRHKMLSGESVDDFFMRIKNLEL